jgi:hypothetical protein
MIYYLGSVMMWKQMIVLEVILIIFIQILEEKKYKNHDGVKCYNVRECSIWYECMIEL